MTFPNPRLKFDKGFTLVELLIVISIIGVLSAILMANFQGVRQRSRDAQRKSDLRQIQSALELYRSDVGSYPASGAQYQLNGSIPCPTPAALASGGNTYLQKIPCDPVLHPYSNQGWGSEYLYNRPTTSTYTIIACIENTNDADPNIVTDNRCPKGEAFSVSNP